MGSHRLLDKLYGCGKLPGDKGYDADWFRNAHKDRGISLFHREQTGKK